jgi:hypothetical protein
MEMEMSALDAGGGCADISHLPFEKQKGMPKWPVASGAGPCGPSGQTLPLYLAR